MLGPCCWQENLQFVKRGVAKLHRSHLTSCSEALFVTSWLGSVSPWCNRTGWLGVKRQLTYDLGSVRVCVSACACMQVCTHCCVCVSACACMQVCTHCCVCVCLRVHACRCVLITVCVCVSACACMQVCTHSLCVCACMHVCVCACMHVCVCACMHVRVGCYAKGSCNLQRKWIIKTKRTYHKWIWWWILLKSHFPCNSYCIYMIVFRLLCSNFQHLGVTPWRRVGGQQWVGGLQTQTCVERVHWGTEVAPEVQRGTSSVGLIALLSKGVCVCVCRGGGSQAMDRY